MEKIVDTIVGWYIGRKISGWHTKLGAAITLVLAAIGVLSVVATSLEMAADGHFYEACQHLNTPEMWAALGALGITKQMLGNRLALDKLATGELYNEAKRPAGWRKGG